MRELVNEGALRWGGAFGERESTIGESACEDALRWGGAFGERESTVGENACEGALRWGSAFGERRSTVGENACEGALRWGGAFGERINSMGGWGKRGRALSLARWGFIGVGTGLSGASVGVFAVLSRVALSRAACAACVALCGDAPFRAVPSRAL